MKHCLALMAFQSYGVRLEVRFKASSWDTLYNRTMELAKYVFDIVYVNVLILFV